MVVGIETLNLRPLVNSRQEQFWLSLFWIWLSIGGTRRIDSHMLAGSGN